MTLFNPEDDAIIRSRFSAHINDSTGVELTPEMWNEFVKRCNSSFKMMRNAKKWLKINKKTRGK